MKSGINMNSQLEAIYDYMARNGKKLKPKKVCNLCKQSDVDFSGNNHVCKNCYPKYVKLGKAEKKEIVRSK